MFLFSTITFGFCFVALCFKICNKKAIVVTTLNGFGKKHMIFKISKDKINSFAFRFSNVLNHVEFLFQQSIDILRKLWRYCARTASSRGTSRRPTAKSRRNLEVVERSVDLSRSFSEDSNRKSLFSEHTHISNRKREHP